MKIERYFVMHHDHDNIQKYLSKLAKCTQLTWSFCQQCDIFFLCTSFTNTQKLKRTQAMKIILHLSSFYYFSFQKLIVQYLMWFLQTFQHCKKLTSIFISNQWSKIIFLFKYPNLCKQHQYYPRGNTTLFWVVGPSRIGVAWSPTIGGVSPN